MLSKSLREALTLPSCSPLLTDSLTYSSSASKLKEKKKKKIKGNTR